MRFPAVVVEVLGRPRLGFVVCACLALGSIGSLTEAAAAQRRGQLPPSVSTEEEPPPTPIADSFVELQDVLEVGDRIVVTDDAGAEIKGRVVDLSRSTLVVDNGERRVFGENRIVGIRRTDSSVNGTLIGLGVGGGVALLAVAANQGGEGIYGAAYIGSWLFPAIGAVGGFFIDRGSGNDPVFARSGSPPSVSLSPLLGETGTGVSVSLRF